MEILSGFLYFSERRAYQLKSAEQRQHFDCQCGIYVEKEDEQDYGQTADPYHAAAPLGEVGFYTHEGKCGDEA